jgi:hypothetical protein
VPRPRFFVSAGSAVVKFMPLFRCGLSIGERVFLPSGGEDFVCSIARFALVVVGVGVVRLRFDGLPVFASVY